MVPLTDTLPEWGGRSPESNLSSVVFPTPFRPTSPVRPLAKLRSRLEKSGLPLGVDQLRLDSVTEADMKTDFPNGKTSGRCCRAEIHCCTHPIEYRRRQNTHLSKEVQLAVSATPPRQPSRDHQRRRRDAHDKRPENIDMRIDAEAEA